MLHLAQRRGFRSNRKGEAEGDDGKLLEAVNENRRRMEQGGYRTVGEMFLKDPAFEIHKRNKGGNYISTVMRTMTEEEARMIFAAQREHGALYATEELENSY